MKRIFFLFKKLWARIIILFSNWRNPKTVEKTYNEEIEMNEKEKVKNLEQAEHDALLQEINLSELLNKALAENGELYHPDVFEHAGVSRRQKAGYNRRLNKALGIIKPKEEEEAVVKAAVKEMPKEESFTLLDRMLLMEQYLQVFLRLNYNQPPEMPERDPYAQNQPPIQQLQEKYFQDLTTWRSNYVTQIKAIKTNFETKSKEWCETQLKMLTLTMLITENRNMLKYSPDDVSKIILNMTTKIQGENNV